MSNSNRNEALISAYLDGELKPEERLQAEKILAEDPRLRRRLENWKEQRDAIRLMSKFELKRDLSEQVLATIQQQQQARTEHLSADNEKAELPKSNANWHLVVVAVAALAGIVLIAVLLRSPDSSRREMAQNDKLVAESGDINSAEAKSEELVSVAESGLASPQIRPRDENFDRPDSVADSALAFEAGVSPGASEELMSLETRIADPSSRRVQEKVEGDVLSPSDVPRVESSLASRSDFQPPSEKEREETESTQMVADRETGVPSPPSQPVAVPQIYVIDFRTGDQPLARVSEVFSRNEIEIFTDETSHNLPAPSTPGDAPTFKQRSTLGLEAIYVMASRDQLDRAIDELSQWANVTGFEVNSALMERQLFYLAAPQEKKEGVQHIEERLRNLNPNFNDPGSRLFQSTAEAPSLDKSAQAKMSPPRKSLAMAQQIPLNERKFRGPVKAPSSENRSGGLESKDLEKGDSDSIAYSTTMDPDWKYAPGGLEGRGGERPAASVTNETNEELVQFLLLIRCPSPSEMQEATPNPSENE